MSSSIVVASATVAFSTSSRRRSSTKGGRTVETECHEAADDFGAFCWSLAKSQDARFR